MVEKAEVVKLWIKRAKADLRSAEATFKEGIFCDSVYHCEQCVQKLIKALILLVLDKEVREHRVAGIFNDEIVPLYPELMELVSIAFEVEKHWLRTRYPLVSEKAVFDPLSYYTKELAEDILNKAEHFYQEILKFLRETFGFEFD